MLDIQNENPTYSAIIMGDVNITLEARDSINRNTNQEELKQIEVQWEQGCNLSYGYRPGSS